MFLELELCLKKCPRDAFIGDCLEANRLRLTHLASSENPTHRHDHHKRSLIDYEALAVF